jgi:hypothetical protein
LGSFLSFQPNADATGFEVYFGRFLSLALILTTIVMMLLIGTKPSPSTASEHVSIELLGPESSIVEPVLHLIIIVHGLIAVYCCVS